MKNLEDFIKDNGGVWGEFPFYPLVDWQVEVANNNTRRGYWVWAYYQEQERHG